MYPKYISKLPLIKKMRERYEPEQKDETKQACNLFNEKTFYRAFIKDMLSAEKEVIIYCPYITKFRSQFFKRTLEKLKRRNINVFIFTRPLEEHDLLMRSEITCALNEYKELGVDIFCLPGFIHEKVAIIDREILWEGSLNILSQRASKEMMRRTPDESSAMQIISYLGLNKKLQEGYKLRYEKLCRNLITNAQHNLKQKIRIFLLGLLVPVIIWLLMFLINFTVFIIKKFF